jgi:1-acyl-sn-glycerol-3-phosphate acyltransferase
LQAPPFLLGTIFFGSLALLASFVDGKPPLDTKSGGKPAEPPEKSGEIAAQAIAKQPRKSRHGRIQHALARIWARASVRAAGARVEVVGIENIPTANTAGEVNCETATACVFAANHTSYMDTPVIFSSLPFQFRILAKKELWPIPFIGWYLHRSGQIPIDTENPRSTISSLGAGVRALRNGMNVFVFPEGGRTPNGELQPFLNGAAYLAIRAQVPLVPVALVGVYELLPIHTRHFYSTKRPLKLVIGKPILTKGLTLRDADKLTAELRETIAGLIKLHSRA